MRGTISKRRLLGGAVVALRPTLSRAARAKPEIERLARRIAAAKAKGDAAAVEQLGREHAWLVVNSI